MLASHEGIRQNTDDQRGIYESEFEAFLGTCNSVRTCDGDGACRLRPAGFQLVRKLCKRFDQRRIYRIEHSGEQQCRQRSRICELRERIQQRERGHVHDDG